MMTTAHTRLLAAILERQDDPGDDETCDRAYWLERLKPGGLSGPDIAAIWTRPGARGAFIEARREALAPVRRTWGERGYDRPVHAMAAADGAPVRPFEGPGYSGVAIAPARGRDSWIISLELKPETLEATPEWTKFRLTDSGGRIWLTGRPEPGFRAIDARWDYDDETPAQRLASHELRMELV